MDKRIGYSITPPSPPREYLFKDKLTGEIFFETSFIPPPDDQYIILKQTSMGGISSNIYTNQTLREYLESL